MELLTGKLQFKESRSSSCHIEVLKKGKVLGIIERYIKRKTDVFYYRVFEKGTDTPVNQSPIENINQAKAVAEYHFAR